MSDLKVPERKLIVTTAQGWFTADRDNSYSMAERLLFMENALNHTENALVSVRQECGQLQAQCAAMLWTLKTINGEVKGVMSEPKVKWCNTKDWLIYIQTLTDKSLSETAGADILKRVRELEQALVRISVVCVAPESDSTKVNAIREIAALVKDGADK